MIRNFIIGVSLVALGLIVVGSLDAARTVSSQFAIANGRSPTSAERMVRRIAWQRDLAFPQRGPVALQPTRVPTIVSGN
jgi:hypothetical protein